MVVFVQMSFGGHHAKEASDQLQKKQQEAMADGDALAAGLAGMNVRDPKGDDQSMASANAETELELLRAQNRQLQGQLNVMQLGDFAVCWCFQVVDMHLVSVRAKQCLEFASEPDKCHGHAPVDLD